MEAAVEDLLVLPEIHHRLFPLRPEERAALEERLLTEGIRDPLVVWPRDGRRILIDGHQRYEIARRHGLSFRVVEKHFADLEDALEWVDRNQLARRNLTDEQRAILIARLYEREKKAPHRPREKRPQNEGVFSPSGRPGTLAPAPAVSPPSAPHPDGAGTAGSPSAEKTTGRNATARAIAAEFGISPATVWRAAQFKMAVERLEAVSAQAAARVLRGEVQDARTHLPLVARNREILQAVADRIAQGETSIRAIVRRLRQERRAERLERRAAQAAENAAPRAWTLLVGDMQVLGERIPAESVHAIITDPPYGREALPLYAALSRLAARVLVPGGLCLVMTGQAYLDEVIAALKQHLTYVWTLAYLTPGSSTQIWARRIKSNWKPVIYCVRGELTWEHVDDVVRSDGVAKDHHPWEQTVDGLQRLVERFTVRGQLVLDPFAGTGTTGLACLRTGRRFLGIEINPQTADLARRRLEAEG